MIRRISKNNDLRDIVKSCPIDVIDNIHTLKYYVDGHEDKAIVPAFEKKENILVAVLPSQELRLHPSGVLYRKALYKVQDERYPDQSYDLEMVDCLDVWLGDEEITPSDAPYLTADDLKTINGESIIGYGDIVIDLTDEQKEQLAKVDQKADRSELVDYAKKSDLPNLEEYVLKESVKESARGKNKMIFTLPTDEDVKYGKITLSDFDTTYPAVLNISSDEIKMEHYNQGHSWRGYNEMNKTGYEIQLDHSKVSFSVDKLYHFYVDGPVVREDFSINYVDIASKSEIPSLEGYATEEWVEGKGYLTEHQDLSNYALKSEIPSLDGYATEEWVGNQGYLTEHQDLSEYAKKSEIPVIPSLDGYATESWVEGKGYLTEHQDLTDYAKKSEIPSLDGYAKESWVEGKGYLTEHQTLKTINGESIIGTGDIVVSGGGGVGMSEGEGKGEIFNRYEGEGKNTATGKYAHAEGSFTDAFGTNSHTEGYDVEVTGNQSHGEGYIVRVSGNGAHAEGYSTTCNADYGHAEGWGSIVNTKSKGGHAEGYSTQTSDVKGCHAEGISNVIVTNAVHMVGIGHEDMPLLLRKNAHTITKDGKHYIPNIGGYEGTETSVSGVQDVATVVNSKMTGTIWTGTQAEWDALSDEVKASYTIALITE